MYLSSLDRFGMVYSDPAGDPAAGGGDPANVPAGGGALDAPAEPSVIEIPDDNALIKVKGSEKPVKFGDHFKSFQAQATRAAQERARVERELIRERTLREQYERERQQAQRQSQSPQEDVYESLRQLPYLSGEDAVNVVQNIGQQIAQRDKILLAALKQMQKMQSTLASLHENHVGSTFEAKISKWLQDGGYDPGYADLAKEIYLAYEGDDLDNEFPKIFASRVEQIEKLMESRRQAKIRAAKPAPFVPGKGGAGSPSKPLDLKGDTSPREVADQLWERLQGSDT